MKSALLATWPLLLTASLALADGQFLERVEMEPRAVEGASVRQLAERGRVCLSQNVVNDAVVLKDTSRVNPMASVATMSAGDTSTVQGGGVLQTVDLDGGLLVAQSRTPMSVALFKYAVESTITLEAREGRFRITHTGIKLAMKDTGHASNDGFNPVRVQPGSPYKKVEAALQALSTKISDCVAAAPAANW